ncbi:MAG: PDE6D/unc-119 family protein [archaeon]|nr:PDE6D/unc-119 family protein [archaeon]
MDKNLTIEEVEKMTEPTRKFLVKLEDNKPGVRFNGFKVRDCDSGEVFHEYYPENVYELDYFADHEIEYKFPTRLLKAKTLGSTLNLVVGDQVVKNLYLAERHYIDGKLAANYNFTFPLFMPKSKNSVEFIYTLPKFGEEVINKMNKKEPIFAKSDTFVFVEGKLVVHRRARYTYWN